jgi:hypothetical protein
LAKDVHLVSSQEQLKFNFFKNYEINSNVKNITDTTLLTSNLLNSDDVNDIFSDFSGESYNLIDSSFETNLNTRLKNKKIY